MTRNEIIEAIKEKQARAHGMLRASQDQRDQATEQGDEIGAQLFHREAVKWSAVWCELEDVKDMIKRMED